MLFTDLRPCFRLNFFYRIGSSFPLFERKVRVNTKSDKSFFVEMKSEKRHLYQVFFSFVQTSIGISKIYLLLFRTILLSGFKAQNTIKLDYISRVRSCLKIKISSYVNAILKHDTRHVSNVVLFTVMPFRQTGSKFEYLVNW